MRNRRKGLYLTHTVPELCTGPMTMYRRQGSRPPPRKRDAKQHTQIMASAPITSWETDGETVETVPDFSFWGSKITVDGDCSHEIKRRLLLGRKVMTNLDTILKSRDTALSPKVRHGYGFSSGHVWI